MAREITIITPENVEVKFELAGLGSRFCAMLIDTIIQALMIVLPVILIWAFVFRFSILFDMPRLPAWLIAVGILLLFSIWNGYFLFFEATRNGQTPGKKSVGIRVILDTGHPIDFRAAVLRNILRTVDSLPAMYSVGFVSIFLSPQYRRLGDYAAGTLVVKTRRKPEKAAVISPQAAVQADPQPTAPEQSPSEQPESLPQESLPYLRTITREEYRAIRHFLNRRRELQDAVAVDLARKLALPMAEKLHIEPERVEDPIRFLDILGREWERRMIH